MPQIKISSPREIRRRVNEQLQRSHNLLDQQLAGSASASSAPLAFSPRSEDGRPTKRRVIAYDLVIDFGRAQDAHYTKVIQAPDLACLIVNCPGRLESISLEDVAIQGDFALVTAALESPACHFVKSFHSYTCRIREETSDLYHFGRALATLPRLQSIALGMSNMSHQPVLGAILTPVLQRPNHALQKIFVNGFCIGGEREENVGNVRSVRHRLQRRLDRAGLGDGAAAARAARGRAAARNHNANDNDDSDDDDDDGDQNHASNRNNEVAQFFSAMESSTTLKRLVCLPMSRSSFAGEAHVEAIARVIRHNTSLHTLELYVHGQANLVPLARAFQYNTTITRFVIDDRSDWEMSTPLARRQEQYATELEAFHEVLKEHNYTLHEFRLDGPSHDAAFRNPFIAPPADAPHLPSRHMRRIQQHLEHLEFQLSLNRMGRARLLAPGSLAGDHVLASTEDWMEAIANQDDPSVIFYFLQKNPSLCLPDPNYQPHQKRRAINTIARAAQLREVVPHYWLSQLQSAVEQQEEETASQASGNVVSPDVSNVDEASPVRPRVLHHEQQQASLASRKRSREEYEEEEEEEEAKAGASTTGTARTKNSDGTASHSNNQSMVGGIIKNVAFYAATFAAGYVARSYTNPN